jgi:hypothetical protein
MSIATDEAEEWAQSMYVGSSHIERHDGCAVSVPDYPQKTNLRREWYIAGRTAEPTESEINAAITEWDRHGYCCRVGTPIVCLCGAKLKNRHEYDTHLLRAMLEEARKAVME